VSIVDNRVCSPEKIKGTIQIKKDLLKRDFEKKWSKMCSVVFARKCFEKMVREVCGEMP
jgi:hypothetical protein